MLLHDAATTWAESGGSEVGASGELLWRRILNFVGLAIDELSGGIEFPLKP